MCLTEHCGFAFIHSENQRGICYPDICSPAEVMIVTSRYSADDISSGMVGVISPKFIEPVSNKTTGKV